ncbi:hypothetical protein GWI33_000484 [Rhynchophorus ferrugineus]|uniref:Carboxylic ester hydrolase n=1 Tax=Rhynchophorus ferrugineus TaxID=354439 RepID=A0A834M3X5_RHYFE|nr:hypothetical protein GWI33_000484 [Rhynchophorus ferrugineus]
MHNYLSVVLVSVLFSISAIDLDENLQVETKNGIVQGLREQTQSGHMFYSFSGIPFAQPPIGDLRWRSPKPSTNWEGVLDATHEGSCCVAPQEDSVKYIQFIFKGSEDCLYLNIFTPEHPKLVTSLLPVYIFIHGGGYFAGCSSRLLYGPENFMEHDVILVTINYRLGVFGFLSTEDLECSGNWGIKDQILAIKWIKDNIRSFGGDDGRITVGGQSSGAASVNLLLLVPQARGLFQNAIMQSGSILCPWSNQTDSREIAFTLGILMGIETNSSKELMRQLRLVDQKRLTKSIEQFLILQLARMPVKGLPFTPVVEQPHEDAILTNYTYDLLRAGNYFHVPVLAGITNFEIGYIEILPNLIKQFLITLLNISPGIMVRNINSLADKYAIGKRIQHFFTGSNHFSEDNFTVVMQYLNDDEYYWPIQKGLTYISRKNPVYFYLFSYEGNMGLTGLESITNITEKVAKGTC